jgi:ribonuclease PH
MTIAEKIQIAQLVIVGCFIPMYLAHKNSVSKEKAEKKEERATERKEDQERHAEHTKQITKIGEDISEVKLMVSEKYVPKSEFEQCRQNCREDIRRIHEKIEVRC